MTPSTPDPRPRLLWWTGLAILLWVAVVGLVARVFWQSILFAVAAQGLLFAGVVLGTAIVARRRDPAEPVPEPPAPPEPGTPRKRVPRLEGAAASVLLPASLAVLVALGGLLYVLPAVDFTNAERVGVAVVVALGAGLALLVGHYTRAPGRTLHEGPGLHAWARSVVGMCGVALAGLALDTLDQPAVADLGTIIPALAGTGLVEALGLALFVGVLASAVEPLVRTAPSVRSWWNLRDAQRPTHLPAANAFVIRLFFSEPNPIRSVFAVLDNTLGIDIRSSWALSFVRRAIEPAIVAVLVLGWLTTGLVMVDTDEHAVRERFGRAADSEVLGPGLHVIFPWPVDQVRRVSTERVRILVIGHEEEDEPVPDALLAALDPGDADDLGDEDALQDAKTDEPESRLWARQHADEEYTLLLGDGRDLVTIDGLLHYRVHDPRAWLYGMQNPEAALRSLAYRAVMERIIAQTLDDALGQDFAQLAADLEVRIQAEADLHKLGVEVVDVTLGALHPPVSVAEDYQAVVSAQIKRDTERIAADAYRTGRLSEARREVDRDDSLARSFAAERRARAVGEAEAFLGLRARVRTAEADYRFRRRMEALEKNLTDRRVVVLDHRLERDGLAVWLEPGR